MKNWKQAKLLIGEEISYNEEKSARAGYGIYDTADGAAWVSDLGDRLEVNLKDGSTHLLWNQQLEEEIAEYFYYWLKNYTDSVIEKVLAKAQDILSDETAMKLLKMLYRDEIDDNARLRFEFKWYFSDEKRDCPQHPKYSKASSIRDALYELYIKD